MPSMNEKDYYAILGVESDATNEQIRKAFQQKARKLHPDVNKEPDAEERFKEVSEAYAVLSDDAKRQRYDAMRSGSPFGGSAGGYASYNGPSSAGTGSYGGDPFSWGFPFGGAYTSRRTQSTPSRAYNPKEGADIVYELTLDDETAAKGARRGISYQRYATCDACHGHGSVAHTHAVTCPTCGGTGRMTVDLASLFGFGVVEMTCPECEGTGRVVEDPCDSCGGSGRVLMASEVVVEIPAGAHDGDVVRVEGMGNAGTNGQASGDFLCQVAIPSERLTSMQAWGLWLMGFAAPFVVLGFLSGGVSIMMVVMMAIGVFITVREGVKLNRGWLNNAGRAFASGATSSLPFLALTLMMGSCARMAMR